MGQSSIFEFMYDTYKITKPVRVIELFAGYGSQHLALTYLGVDVKGHKIVEWAVPSIQAYKDLHYSDVNTDHTKELTDDEIVDALTDYGISANYNEPMKKEQIKRKGGVWCRNVYNNIKNTNNLVNISSVKATDLEITETDKYDYIMTYSFPCQDLSLAGKRLGMDEDSGTRSGLLWEVERILKELNELEGGALPQVLLMENVPQVMAQDNMRNMEKWDEFLSSLGYKSYIKNLIATDYGIPQIRIRTFMISILGDYSYTFPKPIPLELNLSDMLENKVDEKYYLSNKMIDAFTSHHDKYPRKERFIQALKNPNENDVANTITTNAGQRPTDNFVIMPEKTKKGYAEATDGDGIYINRPHQKRGVVQKGKIQTIKTSVKNTRETIYSDKSVDKILSNIVDINGVSKTITANPQRFTIDSATLVVVTNQQRKTRKLTPIVESKNKRLHETLDKVESTETQILDCYNRKTHTELSPTITTGVDFRNSTFLYNDLRIRKLTPRECFRLMGVKDEDFDKIKDNQSNSSLYHLAGNSIVVNVLMAIFKQLL